MVAEEPQGRQPDVTGIHSSGPDTRLAGLKFLFAGPALALYLIALILPSYRNDDAGLCSGFACLTFGAFSAPLLLISYLSNLPFAIGFLVLLFARQSRGLKVAFSFLLISSLMAVVPLICHHGPLMEASRGFSPEIGCFVWIMSQFIVMTGAGLLMNSVQEGFSLGSLRRAVSTGPLGAVFLLAMLACIFWFIQVWRGIPVIPVEWPRTPNYWNPN